MATSAASSVLSTLFGAVQSAFQWALAKLSLNNAADMKANAAAKTEQAIKDDAARSTAADAAALTGGGPKLSDAQKRARAAAFVASGKLEETRKAVRE